MNNPQAIDIKFENVTTLYKEISKLSISKKYANKHFRFWQTETLINQAADLLDRCISDLSTAQSLEAQGINFQHQINQEMSAIERHKELELAYDKANISDISIAANRLTQNNAIRPLHKSARNHAANRYRETPTSESAENTDRAGISLNSQEYEHEEIKRQHERSKLFKENKEEELKIQLEALKELKSQTADGELLDYSYQAKVATGRCERDFKDAYTRLQAAYIGLDQIFKYPHDKLPENASKLGANKDPIDETVNWVRDVIQWMSIFHDHDQHFTVTVSLKERLGEELFRECVTGESIYPFRIDDDEFKNHTLVRFKGMSGFIVSQGEITTPWKLLVDLPEDGPVQQATSKPIDQSGLPRLTLGRVEDRMACRNPEIVGTSSHINASPISASSDDGRWKIEVKPANSDASKVDKIDDIQLEIYLVGQPK